MNYTAEGENMNLIELAKQAGFDIIEGGSVGVALERFAQLVRDATLEEAAMVCDCLDLESLGVLPIRAYITTACASGIRELKGKQ